MSKVSRQRRVAGHRLGWPGEDERGMVAAELAFGSLAVTVACLLGCWVVALGMTFVQCQDVAAEVARQQARDDRAAASRAAERAPQGASVSVMTDGREVTVTVRLQARPWVSFLPAIPLEAKARILVEPGVR